MVIIRIGKGTAGQQDAKEVQLKAIKTVSLVIFRGAPPEKPEQHPIMASQQPSTMHVCAWHPQLCSMVGGLVPLDRASPFLVVCKVLSLMIC